MLQAPNVNNIILEGAKKPKKNIDITLWGLWGRGKDSRLTPDVYTPSGWPAVSTPILRSMAGKPGAAKKALQEMEGAPDQADSGKSHGALPSCLYLIFCSFASPREVKICLLHPCVKPHGRKVRINVLQCDMSHPGGRDASSCTAKACKTM